MKILHVNASYKPAYIYGGPTMSVSMLCEQLHKAGVTVEVFTTTANGPSELDVVANSPLLIDGVKVTYFKRITKDHTHFSPDLLKNLYKHVTGFDAVHIHAWWNLVSVLACLIAVWKRIPVVLSPRGTLSTYSFNNKNSGKKAWIHQLLGKRLLRKIHIHATTINEANSVISLVEPLSINVIPNFVKLPPLTTYNTNISANEPLKLLFFSRIEQKKGLDILLRALPFFNIPFALTIAGSGEAGYINELKKLIPEHLSEKVNWGGFHHDDKFDLLSKHHLMVLPSHDENFGNVVIESLSTGTPVLVSTGVGLAGYVKENNLGWVCAANVTALSDTLNDIYQHHQGQLNRIRQEAPAIIHRHFATDKLVKQYIDFYSKVINE